MNVYLDNNILVDVEMGKYYIEQFLGRQNCTYWFSDSHVEELLEGLGNSKISQERRLALIKEICGDNCILPGVHAGPEFIKEDIVDAYMSAANNPCRTIITKLATDGRAVYFKLSEKIGLEAKTFNNVTYNQVLPMIDARLKECEKIGLIEYLVRSEGIDGRPLYLTLFNLVDLCNYWRDARTDHSEIARLYDASHAYSAQICDVLVSNDKKMRQKAKAVYAFLGVTTEVVSGHEFLTKE